MAEHRKRSRRMTVEEEFVELLQHRIKSPVEVVWAEVRVLLIGVEMPAELDEASRECIFNVWRNENKQRALDAFAEVLRRTPIDVLGPEAKFDEACRKAAVRLGGETHLRGLDSADLRRIWEDWRRVKLSEAEDNFKMWIRECGNFSVAAAEPEARNGQGA